MELGQIVFIVVIVAGVGFAIWRQVASKKNSKKNESEKV